MAAERDFWRFFLLSALAVFTLAGFLYNKRTGSLKVSSIISEHQEPSPQSPYVSLPPTTTRHPLIPPYPYPYTFLMNPLKKCQSGNPFLVLLVVSVSPDIRSRLAIRETWGNESNYGNVSVVTVFLVGLPTSVTDKVQQELEEENRIYGDIVQQDFMDTYYNLTLKTLMGMEWVAKYCPTASYVMKIDSDMFLNVEYLIHKVLLPDSPVRNNYLTGYIVPTSGPMRSKAYKWYVPKEVYPNDTYPPYCAGPGYVFSADLTQKIYDVAQTIRVIPMEDSFIGICMYELKIPLTTSPPNVFNGHWIDYERCLYNKLVTVHHYTHEKLREVWTDFWSKRKSECPKK
ncbi:hypothetical protein GDO86_017898 [Hymenochirus boettgeri]|uniref:Hexosyltransferase n=1 Tax=Hymenochirus boettgeri TaxID=247094 RepID=A0A8T2IIJ7_9PIPI|nr:hypothetical protein GDO86_017898 [Hymenochirus boettgeri]